MPYNNPCDYSHLHPLLREEIEAHDRELDEMIEKWNSESKKEDPNKMIGYVARDENGKLHFFHREPYKGSKKWEQYTTCLWDYVIELPDTMFPALKWSDKPWKVKLSLNVI